MVNSAYSVVSTVAPVFQSLLLNTFAAVEQVTLSEAEKSLKETFAATPEAVRTCVVQSTVPVKVYSPSEVERSPPLHPGMYCH